MEKKKKRLLELIPLKVLLVGILFLISLFLFALIAHEAVSENEKFFDEKVSAYISSFATPGFINVMKVFTFFGSSWFLLPAYIILIGFFFLKKKYRYGIDIAVTGISSTLLIHVLKLVFHRRRPDLPIIKGITTYSFPSGHTLSAFVFFSILIFILSNGKWKRVYKWIFSVLLMLFAVSIGISRIALKTHYPTDVIASFCLGIAWTILSFTVLKMVNRKF